MIKVSFDRKGFRLAMDEITEDATKAAGIRALNKTAISVRAYTKKQIKEVLGATFSQKESEKRFRIFKATRQIPRAKLRVAEDAISLHRLKPKRENVTTAKGWKRKGASVEVGGDRVFVPTGFIAKGASGNRLVFARADQTQNNSYEKSGPKAKLRKLFDKDLPGGRSLIGVLFSDTDVREQIKKYAHETFQKIYQRELASVARRMEKRKGGK